MLAEEHMTVWTRAHTDCLCKSPNASQMPSPREQRAHGIPHPACTTSACLVSQHSKSSWRTLHKLSHWPKPYNECLQTIVMLRVIEGVSRLLQRRKKSSHEYATGSLDGPSTHQLSLCKLAQGHTWHTCTQAFSAFAETLYAEDAAGIQDEACCVQSTQSGQLLGQCCRAEFPHCA